MTDATPDDGPYSLTFDEEHGAYYGRWYCRVCGASGVDERAHGDEEFGNGGSARALFADASKTSGGTRRAMTFELRRLDADARMPETATADDC